MKSYWFYIFYALLAGSVLFFLIFYKLDVPAVFLWDESRLAINALECLNNGNWLVMHYAGKPDLWNTKPPLAIWLQVLSMKAFGISELSLRLPTAIAVLMTVFYIYYFVHRCGKADQAPKNALVFVAVAGCVMLLTSTGYTSNHGSRSADYEGILLLFMTIGYGYIFFYTQFGQKRSLLLAAAFLGLGVLTKSVQALVPLPFVLFWFVKEQKLVPTFKNPVFYASVLVFLLLGPSYYLIREWASAGYIDAAWNNDIGGRYGSAVEGHTGAWYTYILALTTKDQVPWAILACLFPFVARSYPYYTLRNFAYYCLGIGLAYQFIVAFSGTKTGWYGAPSYPFMAITSGICLHAIWLRFAKPEHHDSGRSLMLLATFVLMPFVVGRTVFYHNNPDLYQDTHDFGLSRVAQAIFKNEHKPSTSDILFCAEVYYPHLEFYRHMLSQKNIKMQFVSRDSLVPGQVVYVNKEAHKAELDTRWISTKEYLGHDVVIYHLEKKVAKKE
jgi:4-amino-4-deoxy-L-arabinose transferase-like glycosyltransferase